MTRKNDEFQYTGDEVPESHAFSRCPKLVERFKSRHTMGYLSQYRLNLAQKEEYYEAAQRPQAQTIP